MVNRLKKSFTAIPESVKEAVKYLLSIGEAQKKINAAKRKAKAEVDQIQENLEKEVAPLVTERDRFFTALFAFAQGKKEELTAVLRSVKTKEGTFGWRWTPPSVKVEVEGQDEIVIAYLRAHKLNQYVRVIYQLDREALLRDRPDVPGISYVSTEEFFAKPKLLQKVDGNAQELTKDIEKTEAIDV
jgi:phage host-nuclease inhibitor protein Gam